MPVSLYLSFELGFSLGSDPVPTHSGSRWFPLAEPFGDLQIDTKWKKTVRRGLRPRLNQALSPTGMHILPGEQYATASYRQHSPFLSGPIRSPHERETTYHSRNSAPTDTVPVEGRSTLFSARGANHTSDTAPPTWHETPWEISCFESDVHSILCAQVPRPYSHHDQPILFYRSIRLSKCTGT